MPKRIKLTERSKDSLHGPRPTCCQLLREAPVICVHGQLNSWAMTDFFGTANATPETDALSLSACAILGADLRRSITLLGFIRVWNPDFVLSFNDQ